MINKRQFRRINFREAVEFQIPGSSKWVGCLSHDLSEGGIRIRIPDFIPPKTEIMMNFALDRNKVVSATGRVIWVQRVPHGESYQLGLEFLDKGSNYFGKKRIRHYIESRSI